MVLSRAYLDGYPPGNIGGLKANVTAVINGFEGMQVVVLNEQKSYLQKLTDNQDRLEVRSGSKPWDRGGPYFYASIHSSLFFKIWDPGGSLSSVAYYLAFHTITLRTR